MTYSFDSTILYDDAIKDGGLYDMFTAQILDGVKVMTDATWSVWDFDELGQIYEDTYFAKSAKFFKTEHIWDTKEYSKWSSAPSL